jgi:hypothetical protein
LSEITFHAAVHQVKTLADNGLIISFELPETEVMQAAQLMECKRQGIYLNVTCTTALQRENNNAIHEGQVRKSER